MERQVLKEKKIKVFVDAHSFDKEFQGARTFIAGIYNCLLQRTDLEIYFGLKNDENLLKDIPAIKKQNILHYRTNNTFSRFAIDIPKLISHHQIDVAHFQYLAPFGPKKCSYIVTTHDILFKDFKKKFSLPYRVSRDILFKRALKLADIKTTVSTYSAQQIAKHYHIPLNQIHILPNGVSKGFQTNISKQDAVAYIKEKYGVDNYILCVSRVEPRKNQSLLLRIFLDEKFYEKGISLVLVGKYSIKDAPLDALLSALPPAVKKYVYLIEQADDKTLKALYKACHFFAYPSKAEGFGIPPLEAGMSGVRVLCSNQTAMADFTFFAPYFANPAQEVQWSALMQQMADDNTMDEGRLQAIANEIRERYNWQHTADKLYDLIRLNYKG